MFFTGKRSKIAKPTAGKTARQQTSHHLTISNRHLGQIQLFVLNHHQKQVLRRLESFEKETMVKAPIKKLRSIPL